MPTCPACGYDLSGLPAAAACPECAHRATHRNALRRHFSRTDRAALRSGCTLLIWGLNTAALCLVPVLAAVVGGAPFDAAPMILLFDVVNLAATLTLALGVLRFARPRPTGPTLRALLTPVAVMRVCALFLVVITTLFVAMASYAVTSGDIDDAIFAAFCWPVFKLLALAAFVPLVWSITRHVGTLAQQVPDPALAARAATAASLLPVLSALFTYVLAAPLTASLLARLRLHIDDLDWA